MTTTDFSPPSKGPWELDGTHFPRPVSPIASEIYSSRFPQGMAQATLRHGLMMDRLAYATVHGWFYNQVRIIGAPAGAAVPPRFIFFLATRLHPGIRERTRIARKVWDEKPWRQDVERWHSELKPARIRAHLALLGERLGTLSDTDLVAHLRRCVAVYGDSAQVHGYLTIPSMMPVGDFVAHAREWTSLAPPEILAALASSSPISAGREPTRDALVELLRKDTAARAALNAPDEPSSVLDALLALPNAAGATARAYLDGIGYRTLSSYDVLEPFALEVPYVIVESLRVLMNTRGGGIEERAAQSRARVRDQVPQAHRTQYDALFEEARLTSSIRDERVLFNDYWSAGVTRRALLEVGRRLTAKGLLERADHATACGVAELEDLLVASKVREGETPAQRWTARRKATMADAPATLGPKAPAPPPVEWLPAPLRRGQVGTFACLDAIFGDSTDAPTAAVVKGFGVSPGKVQGPARVVLGPDDFHRLRPGDVLVARTTSPTYNIVLPLLGGIVTDRGGALSHAAIVSREYGIPGVVGCRNATLTLPDGAPVMVNGDTGECRVLA